MEGKIQPKKNKKIAEGKLHTNQKGKKSMKRILWFSRHSMSDEQKDALTSKLGEIEITQIDRTISLASELADEIAASDIIAVVAPIGLQQQFLKLAGDKPVIVAVTDRVFVAGPEGESQKAEFVFREWQRLLKIEVITEHFC